MSLIKWEPLDDVGQFFTDRYLPLWPKISGDLAVDVYEEEGNVIAQMSLPGVAADEVTIEVDADLLTISGNRAEEKETEEKDYYSKEIRRGSFTRSVRLPRSVDAKQASATFDRGILVVTMPSMPGTSNSAVKVPVT